MLLASAEATSPMRGGRVHSVEVSTRRSDESREGIVWTTNNSGAQNVCMYGTVKGNGLCWSVCAKRAVGFGFTTSMEAGGKGRESNLSHLNPVRCFVINRSRTRKDKTSRNSYRNKRMHREVTLNKRLIRNLPGTKKDKKIAKNCETVHGIVKYPRNGSRP